MKPSESAKIIKRMAGIWIFSKLDELFLFSAEDISDKSELPIAVVKKYLNHLSLEFGSIDEFFRLPRPTHPLMKKSLIKLKDKYYCPVFQLQFSNLKRIIENFINPDSDSSVASNYDLWSKYDNIRSSFLETEGSILLNKALKTELSYENLSYSIIEKGENKIVELDGLIIHDTNIFLVEAKAGSMSPSARRGAEKRIKKDLQSLVEEAYHQCLRAKNYILQNNEVEFSLPDGKKLTLKHNNFNHIFMVNLTLDTLDAFVTNSY